MAGVYNSFQIKYNGNTDVGREIVDRVIREHDFRFNDYLVWEKIESDSNTISAEDYLSFSYEDYERSRDLFMTICARIAAEDPDVSFSGCYSFAYSNIDSSNCLFVFYQDWTMKAYEGGSNDGEGFLNGMKVFALEDDGLAEIESFEYDKASSAAFNVVHAAYDEGEMPDFDPEEYRKEERKDKFTLNEGKLYRVSYIDFGSRETLVGRFSNRYEQYYWFVQLGGDPQSVDEEFIESVDEVAESEQIRGIEAEYANADSAIKAVQGKLTELRERFCSLFMERKDTWDRKPLEQISTSSYPVVAGVEEGKTYLTTMKSHMKEAGNDAVLILDRSRDAIGEKMNVAGCFEEMKMMRPVVVFNLDQFMAELILDDEGAAIQAERLQLHNEAKRLSECRNELKKAFQRATEAE